MQKKLKAKIARRIILPLSLIHSFLIKRNSIFRKTGWITSYINEKPVDTEGRPLPWMNYAVIDLLKKRLNKNLTIFEWGSGYSTLFFSERVKHITSIEYNTYWFNLIKTQVPPNANIILRDSTQNDYITEINKQQENYHLILIDGRARVQCFEASLKNIHMNGVIILDDSDREKYQEIFRIAAENNYKHIDFIGNKPGSHKIHQTTIFYRQNNCLEI